jgi:hypothetical protein
LNRLINGRPESRQIQRPRAVAALERDCHHPCKRTTLPRHTTPESWSCNGARDLPDPGWPMTQPRVPGNARCQTADPVAIDGARAFPAPLSGASARGRWSPAQTLGRHHTSRLRSPRASELRTRSGSEGASRGHHGERRGGADLYPSAPLFYHSFSVTLATRNRPRRLAGAVRTHRSHATFTARGGARVGSREQCP